jgi:hypothetical protein
LLHIILTAEEYIQSGAIAKCLKSKASDAEQQELVYMESTYSEVHGARLATENYLKKPAMLITAAPKPVRWLRGALAVCALLLMALIALGMYFYSRATAMRNQLKNERAIVHSLRSSWQADALALTNDPDTRTLQIVPVAGATSIVKGLLYWHPPTGITLLKVHTTSTPPADLSYHLWTSELPDGSFQYLGEIDTVRNFQPMYISGKVSHYLITLESQPAGNSPSGSIVAEAK